MPKVKPISDILQKRMTWIGQKLSSPHQRLLQGAVALAIQPVIEYKNKDVDDDTRAVATARIIGKVISGFVVGVAVRAGCIMLMKKFAKTPPTKEFEAMVEQLRNGIPLPKRGVKNFLAPSVEQVKKLIDEKGKHLGDIYSDHQKGMGTLIGTLAGLYTNFAVDVPMTKWITNKTTPVVKGWIDKDNKKAAEKIAMKGNQNPAPVAQTPTSPAIITSPDDYFIKPGAIAQGGANG